MNGKQAKQIPLAEILHRLGYEPAWEKRDELAYQSPFRKEKVPSFFLNTAKNVWHDFGHGGGGNVIDFIMIYYDIASVSTALRQLDELCGPQEWQTGAEKSLAAKDAEGLKPSKPLHLLKIQSLQNKVLLQYLKQRGICRQMASPYVKEIYYSLRRENQEKRYFALAFPNLSGGYELRNPYFKGSIGKKDISLLAKRKRRGVDEKFAEAVTIFEGFMDFLSALCFFQVAEAKTSVIVLNSVSLKERAIEQIRANRFEKVYLYLDRDDAGTLLFADFRKQLSNIALSDKSDLYIGYKDFNEFLVSTSVLSTSHSLLPQHPPSFSFR